MKKLKTVEIGISAYNEATTIYNLLHSLLRQNKKNFILSSITVACDGSTDKSASIVKKVSKKYPIIHLINDGKRLGKAQRLNYFYKHNVSDIFLALDADIILTNNMVISEIVNVFNTKNVEFVGGNALPLLPLGTFEKILYTWHLMWNDMKININNGINVHNHLGCISGVSKKFSQKLILPNYMISDDDFIFFSAIRLGYKFGFAKNAIVYYRAVNNFNDFILQHTRFLNCKKYIEDYFGNWVYPYYKVPKYRKLKTIIRFFIKTPLYTVAALSLQMVLRSSMTKYKIHHDKVGWDLALSTKGVSL